MREHTQHAKTNTAASSYVTNRLRSENEIPIDGRCPVLAGLHAACRRRTKTPGKQKNCCAGGPPFFASAQLGRHKPTRRDDRTPDRDPANHPPRASRRPQSIRRRNDVDRPETIRRFDRHLASERGSSDYARRG